MMLRIVGAALCMAAAVCAQHGGPGRGAVYGDGSGFGNVVFPGTGRPPVPGGQFSISNPNFASQLGNTVAGVPYTGVGAGFGHPIGRPRPFVPYGFPILVGGYSYYQPPQQPNVTIIYPQAAPVSPSPGVVIQQNFGSQQTAPAPASDPVRVYEVPARAPAPAPSPDEPRMVLVVLKDGSIYSSWAYWVEGDTFHYVTTKGVHNQASVELVDLDMCRRINRERGIDFNLRKN